MNGGVCSPCLRAIPPRDKNTGTVNAKEMSFASAPEQPDENKNLFVLDNRDNDNDEPENDGTGTDGNNDNLPLWLSPVIVILMIIGLLVAVVRYRTTLIKNAKSLMNIKNVPVNTMPAPVTAPVVEPPVRVYMS